MSIERPARRVNSRAKSTAMPLGDPLLSLAVSRAFPKLIPTRIAGDLFRRRFLDWRRQRRRSDVAPSSVGPDRARAESQVVFVDVVLATRVLLQLLVGFSKDP